MRSPRRAVLGALVAGAVLAAPAPALAAELTVKPPGRDGHTNDTTPTLTGTAFDEAGDDTLVYLSIEGNGDDLIGVAERTGSTWTAEVDVPLGQGVYDVYAEQERGSGAVVTVRDTLTIDTTAPTAAPKLQVFGKGLPDGSTQVTPTFTLTYPSDEAGASYECSIDAAPWTSCAGAGDSNLLPGTRLSAAPGAHTVRVRAVDRAGNPGPPAELRIVVVAPAPVAKAPLFTPKPPTSTSGPGFAPGTFGLELTVAGRMRPKGGQVPVMVRTTYGFGVRVKVELRTKGKVRVGKGRARVRRLGLRSLRLAANRRTVVRLRLDRTSRSLLRKRGRLPARLTVTFTDPTGGVRVLRSDTTLVR